MVTPSGPKYQRPLRIARKAKTPPVDARRRTAGKPYLPAVNTDTPPTGEYLYLVYLNDGSYFGWMEADAAHKWMFTIYYPTANKYKIKTKKDWYTRSDDSRSHKIIYEVATGDTALVFVNKSISETDLVDPTNIKQMVAATVKGVMDQGSIGSIGSYNPPDPFGLLQKIIPTARQEYHKEREVFDKALLDLQKEYEAAKAEIQQQIQDGPEANLRKKLVDRLNDLATAEDEKNKGSEEAGANLDF